MTDAAQSQPLDWPARAASPIGATLRGLLVLLDAVEHAGPPMVSRGTGRRAPTENVAVDIAFVDAVAADLARVQRLARILTGDVTLAEDLVAEALARTLPLWRTGRVDDVPAYVRRVVANLASHQWRRRALARRRDHRALDWMMSARDASPPA